MNKCKKCGEPAPEGRELCWCCRHTKLHPSDPNEVWDSMDRRLGEEGDSNEQA